ncbi:large neutral amino acids transporter small subunit 4-like isoform X1 [Branchiostoma lanceolatum]|uniref:large neutral amino acids transporter small subunit 4-like isoform X1 n=1 Tax=Branchiostoma lanceolatum TaxID=7740 RepID=UPI0034521516
MAPCLFTAQRRRYWLIITAIIENLLFSAVLLGWGSLVLMLKKEGIYLELCSGHDTDYLNITDANITDNMTVILPMEEEGCIAQDERLNLAYTIGSFLLSGMTFPLGMFMDKFGSRNLRMAGSVMFGLSSVLFAIAARTKMSILLFPAVSLNGMSGIVHVFTGFQVTNLFGDKRGTMMSFFVGAYASSAVVFPAMKGLYDLGIPFDTLFFCYAGLMVFVILNCYFNVPKEPIPGPEEMDFRIKFRPFGVHHKLTGKHFYGMVTTVGRRLSIDEKGGPTMASHLNLEMDYSSVDHAHPVAAIPPLSKSICTMAFFWSVVTMCIGQLRLIFFIGALSQMLGRVSGADSSKGAQYIVNIYTSIFGMIQMACILMAPLIGIVLDWNTRPKKSKGAKEELLDDTCNGKGSTSSEKSVNITLNKQKQQQKVKLQKISNVMKAFALTNVLMIFFGVTVLIPSLELQILTFLLHTLIRGFIHSTVGAMYATMYHHTHFGTLTGLQSLISAVFACLQYPVFTIINGPLNEDPFWMNVGLLVLTFFNFGLPAYLFLYVKRLKAEPEVGKPKTSVVSVDLPKNMSSKTLITTIKEEELDNDDVFMA